MPVFKLFLKRDKERGLFDSNVEVKIIDIVTDFDQIRSYNRLHQAILSAFPKLKGATYELYWIDSEKDRVSIDNAADFALCTKICQPMPLVKLVIVATEPLCSEPVRDLNVGPEHMNILCDGCDDRVYGVRYKCIQCADYDLCANCFNNSAHFYHKFKMIVHPALKMLSADTVNRFWRVPSETRLEKDEELAAKLGEVTLTTAQRNDVTTQTEAMPKTTPPPPPPAPAQLPREDAEVQTDVQLPKERSPSICYESMYTVSMDEINTLKVPEEDGEKSDGEWSVIADFQ